MVRAGIEPALKRWYRQFEFEPKSVTPQYDIVLAEQILKDLTADFLVFHFRVVGFFGLPPVRQPSEEETL